MTTDLTGTTAIVTGATGAMGRAIVTRLAEAGADVIATDISDDSATTLMTTAPLDGGRAQPDRRGGTLAGVIGVVVHHWPCPRRPRRHARVLTAPARSPTLFA